MSVHDEHDELASRPGRVVVTFPGGERQIWPSPHGTPYNGASAAHRTQEVATKMRTVLRQAAEPWTLTSEPVGHTGSSWSVLVHGLDIVRAYVHPDEDGNPKLHRTNVMLAQVRWVAEP
jgi:hypothetical protein